MTVGGATEAAVSTRCGMSYATMTVTAQIQGTTFAITHASRETEVLRANQDQLKARVSAALGHTSVRWSDVRSPCLKDLGVLVSRLQNLETTRHETILFDQTQATALEGRQGAQLVLRSSYETDVADLVAFLHGPRAPGETENGIPQ
jgi:hypothetical protein